MDERPRITLSMRFFRFLALRRYAVWAVLLLLALWSYGFYALGVNSVYRANPGLSGQEQAAQILQKIGQLIQLPQNEAPTMAAITDAAKVRQSQPFLVNAEDGDVLIVYPNAAEAILYRPSTGKLIAVGPVNTPSGHSTTEASVSNESIATSTNATTTPKKK